MRGNENRHDWCVVTRAMEVLEIECVVPHLVECLPSVLALSRLELDRKHYSSGNNDSIDPAAKSRHIELEVEVAVDPCERNLQDLDRFFPSAALRNANVEVAGCGQNA